MTNNEITAAYYGVDPVSKIYLGDELVWGGEPGPDYSKMPLTFEILSAGTIVWRASNSADTLTIQYSKDDGLNWTSITSSTGGTNISVNAGDKVQFRGDNPRYYLGYQRNSNFSGTTARFELEGNIMSLIDSTGYATATTLASSNTFNNLFSYCYGLTSAENLVLPATTLANSCYDGMFDGCTSLTTAPSLPATTLTERCYQGMFRGCVSLTSAPELPATALADGCYSLMFFGCTSLTTAPALPATTLAYACYTSMFYNCTSLTTAPELPATTLTGSCYGSMFSNCTSLTTAPELPATTLANSCYSSMFRGCTSLTTAPELPATTLANSCYSSMFKGCTSLNYIKCLATDISASNCTYEWVQNVASSGTFVGVASTDWSLGVNGIPEGWSSNVDAITLSTGSINLTEPGQTKTFNVASTQPWSATTIPSWVTLSQTAGTYGITTITVTATTIPSTEVRDSLIISTASKSATLTIDNTVASMVPFMDWFSANEEALHNYLDVNMCQTFYIKQDRNVYSHFRATGVTSQTNYDIDINRFNINIMPDSTTRTETEIDGETFLAIDFGEIIKVNEIMGMEDLNRYCQDEIMMGNNNPVYLG